MMSFMISQGFEKALVMDKRIFVLTCVLLFSLNPVAAANPDESIETEIDNPSNHKLSSTASSETIELEAFYVEETPVTADPIVTLQGPELRIRLDSTLGKTLERELGVSNLSYGPGVGQPVIRGMAGPRVRIMQNGIGTHDLSSLSPDLAIAFETMLAENITILKGPATLRYGSNAIGGLVDIKHQRIPDKIPENGIEGRTDFSYNHNSDDKAGMIGLDAGKGLWAFHVDYFQRASDLTHIPGYALDEDAIRQQFQVEPTSNSYHVIENSQSDSQGGSVGLSMIGKYGYVGASYHEMTRNYGIPPGVPGHNEPGANEQEAIRIDMSQRRYDLEGLWETPWSYLPQINAKLSYVDYDHKDFDESIADQDSTLTQFDNSVWESRLEMNHRGMDWLDGTFGMQWQHRSFSASGIETYTPPATAESFGYFLTESMFFTDAFSLEAGVRIEQQTTTPDSQEIKLPGLSSPLTLPDELDFLTYSIALGLKYQILPQTSLYLNWQLAQRAPDIQELLASGPHFATRTYEIGRIDLDPEQTNHFEVGIQFTDESITFQTNAYYKIIEDFIYLENQGIFFNLAPDPPRFQTTCANLSNCLPVFAYQAETAHFAGYETEITYSPQLNLTAQPHLTIFSDYVRGWFKNDNLGDVPRLPPLRLGGEIGLQWANWQGNIRYTHGFKQDKPGHWETDTPSYHRLDMDISYDWKMTESQKILFFTKFSNITDSTIRNSTSFLRNFAPEAGFSTTIGLSASF
jgi:iron complex outermembrane receptor protein